MSVQILEGDNRESLEWLPENSVDAVVTDPPYSLTSITKRFGKEGSAPVKGGDGSFGRVSGGFMGKAWDATGIERDPAFWSAVYRVLKPGGFVFAFAGARTGHWQACAMEQAGFVMHPMHAWLYGQGFPKGHSAAKEIDEAMGRRNGTIYIDDDGNRIVPLSPEGEQWDGWKYGTQTQKPAMEPIYLGQKPYDGKPVESILKWGVGAFNVDACRVPAEEGRPWRQPGNAGLSLRGSVDGSLRNEIEDRSHLGRYPANVLHDGSEVAVALFPESAGQLATESSSSSSRRRMARGSAGREPRGDSGSAARFFNSFPADDIPWPLAFYHAKAGKADRAGSKHPTVKPIGLLRHLIRHICPSGGTVLDPFAGSGTTAEAARLEGMACILMEQEADYLAFLRKRFAVPDVSDASADKEDIFG